MLTSVGPSASPCESVFCDGCPGAFNAADPCGKDSDDGCGALLGAGANVHVVRRALKRFDVSDTACIGGRQSQQAAFTQ